MSRICVSDRVGESDRIAEFSERHGDSHDLRFGDLALLEDKRLPGWTRRDEEPCVETDGRDLRRHEPPVPHEPVGTRGRLDGKKTGRKHAKPKPAISTP